MPATANATLQLNTTYTKILDAISTYSGNPKLSATPSYSTSDISYVVSAVQNATTGAVTYNVRSLTDAYGASVNMATVKGMWLYNNSASTVVVGGGSNPLFGTDQYTLKGQQLLPITSPFASSTGACNIQVTPSGSATWQLILLGS